jgi:hypothetical protein
MHHAHHNVHLIFFNPLKPRGNCVPPALMSVALHHIHRVDLQISYHSQSKQQLFP